MVLSVVMEESVQAALAIRIVNHGMKFQVWGVIRLQESAIMDVLSIATYVNRIKPVQLVMIFII